MTILETTPTTRRRAGRPAGYLIAAILNVVGLWLVHQLLGWGWPRFLTDDFDQLLGVVSLSFVASIAFNVAWVAADPPWFKALGDLVTTAIGLWVAVRTLQVFPFDFSSYAVNWSWLARTFVIVGIVGTSIGVMVNLVKLTTALLDPDR